MPECPQPIALPVRHTKYPASGGLPTDRAVSEATAVGRVRLGNPADLGGNAFAVLHDEFLLKLVAGGPFGPAMNKISQSHTGVAEPPVKESSPKLEALFPLQLVILGALNAPVAQALGMYWVDESSGARHTLRLHDRRRSRRPVRGQRCNLLGWLAGPTPTSARWMPGSPSI